MTSSLAVTTPSVPVHSESRTKTDSGCPGWRLGIVLTTTPHKSAIVTETIQQMLQPYWPHPHWVLAWVLIQFWCNSPSTVCSKPVLPRPILEVVLESSVLQNQTCNAVWTRKSNQNQFCSGRAYTQMVNKQRCLVCGKPRSHNIGATHSISSVSLQFVYFFQSCLETWEAETKLLVEIWGSNILKSQQTVAGSKDWTECGPFFSPLVEHYGAITQTKHCKTWWRNTSIWHCCFQSLVPTMPCTRQLFTPPGVSSILVQF